MRYRTHPAKALMAVLGLALMLSMPILLEPAPGIVTENVTLQLQRSAPRVRLAADKAALARHIATLYRQPLAQIARIVDAAFETGAKLGVPPGLLLAIVAQESSFDARARSGYGALGLMQVVPRFHQDKVQRIEHPDGLLHPEANLEVGARVLREYWFGSGDLVRALERYSGGARRYAQKVFANWQQFESVRAQPDAALALIAS